jgi:uncharacterized protein YyaL (SSP411 family)
VAHRELSDGGFSHDAHDSAGPYLGDTLAMGRAFLALYSVTAEKEWLERAQGAADFIASHFRLENRGWAASATTASAWPAPGPQFDENIALARFTNLLHRYTGRASYRQMAEHALEWAERPGVTGPRGAYLGGLILAHDEFWAEPSHVMVVGRKNDAAAKNLFAVAAAAPGAYRLVEWWDRGEGAAPRGESFYPELERAAAFTCHNGACSRPIFESIALAAKLR